MPKRPPPRPAGGARGGRRRKRKEEGGRWRWGNRPRPAKLMPKRPPPRPVGGATDRRIDRLLGLLVDNATVVVSGAKIASQVGVSRSAVWRWVGTLRGLGVRIKD